MDGSKVGMRRRRRSRAAVALLLCGLGLPTLWSAAVSMHPGSSCVPFVAKFCEGPPLGKHRGVGIGRAGLEVTKEEQSRPASLRWGVGLLLILLLIAIASEHMR